MILLSPHHDDETLFAAFACIAYRPRIVVVLESHLQEQRGNGITDADRKLESRAAADQLGCEIDFWPFRDDRPDWAAVADAVRALDGPVFAPAVVEGAHDHHNALGEAAAAAARGPLHRYHTYDYRTSARHALGDLHAPAEPDWVRRKLLALACYPSQIRLWPQHFLENQREYVEWANGVRPPA